MLQTIIIVLRLLLIGFVVALLHPTLGRAAECAKGNLITNYSQKECTVGNLDFKFDEITVSKFNGSADQTEVEPVANGLKFSIPLVKPKSLEAAPPIVPRYITVELGLPFQVKGTDKSIVDVTLAGGLGALAKGATSEVQLKVTDPSTSSNVKLSLTGFNSTKGTFATPVAAGTFIPVVSDFAVHRVDTGTLTFTVTFTSST